MVTVKSQSFSQKAQKSTLSNQDAHCWLLKLIFQWTRQGTPSLGWQSNYNLSYKNKNTSQYYNTKIFMTDYSNYISMGFRSRDFDSVRKYYQISIVYLFQQNQTFTFFGFLPTNLLKLWLCNLNIKPHNENLL